MHNGRFAKFKLFVFKKKLVYLSDVARVRHIINDYQNFVCIVAVKVLNNGHGTRV